MEDKIILDVVNTNAAGIDIGSRSHWVAVGQTDADIKEFGATMKTFMLWQTGSPSTKLRLSP